MTKEIRYPHIYAMLKAAGHDSAKAAEIVIDAQRKDAHARIWIKTLAASRRTSCNQVHHLGWDTASF